MKKVWITALEHNQEQVQKVMGLARQYGLDGNGHFWADDLINMAWLSVKDTIVSKDTSLWVLIGSQKSLESDSVRLGLSLLTMSVQAQKGYGFPLMFVDTGDSISTENWPTPLKSMDTISFNSPSLGAKMVAKANTPVPEIVTGYRLDIHASPHIGVWFEIGPSGNTAWNGALLGASGGKIDAHGVGDAGHLPQKAVLRYPMKGLKLQSGDKEYTAWAVQNKLDEKHSYYVRVQDKPDSIVFGSYESEDEASVHVINLI
ncbi:MAG: hypothetical protein JXB48_02150 [Candidatus Latescibacteria bacterium]|nr:hypothetical protein [Candidatus Latescibacterota bacterium]